MALVYEPPVKSEDDSEIYVIDINGVLKVGPNTYLIKTQSFDDSAFADGAGDTFTWEERATIKEKL